MAQMHHDHQLVAQPSAAVCVWFCLCLFVHIETLGQNIAVHPSTSKLSYRVMKLLVRITEQDPEFELDKGRGININPKTQFWHPQAAQPSEST